MRRIGIVAGVLAAVAAVLGALHWQTAGGARAQEALRPATSYAAVREVVCRAIRSGNQVLLDYSGRRTVEPHAFGVGRNGEGYLRAWQVEGASVAGQPAGWKLFRVDRMQGIGESARRMGELRPGYRRGDRIMARVDCER